VTLTAVPEPSVPGDFNTDGAVDAADYIVWRENEGTTNSLPNDNGIGGTIGQVHYDLWRARFGESIAGGAGDSATAAVPEPATQVLLFLTAAAACPRRSRIQLQVSRLVFRSGKGGANSSNRSAEMVAFLIFKGFEDIPGDIRVLHRNGGTPLMVQNETNGAVNTCEQHRGDAWCKTV
jgi:hypothetical protein